MSDATIEREILAKLIIRLRDKNILSWEEFLTFMEELGPADGGAS